MAKGFCTYSLRYSLLYLPTFQRFDHRSIGLQQVGLVQILNPNPGELLAFPGVRLTRVVRDAPQIQQNSPVGVLVFVADEGFGADERYTQFLVEFAPQRIEATLSRASLAAGKLPLPRHMLARRPLRDQHAVISIKQGASQHMNYSRVNEPVDLASRAIGVMQRTLRHAS